MHLDKLLSWDDLRDHVSTQQKQRTARIAESHFYAEEKHDVFARVQLLELSENGDYLPVEVLQANDMDKGTFQLHQGLQRRIVVNLTHSCGSSLPWKDSSRLRIGGIQLLDHLGKVVDMNSSTPEIELKLVMDPIMRANSNGSMSVALVGQWDSSLHNSLLLDRMTADKYKVQMKILWDVTSDSLGEPMTFSLNVASQVLSRSYVRNQSMFAALWQSARIVHSTSAIFSICIRPMPVKKVGDLWRMNTQHDYVKGEENLTGWTPRGVSLVHDFINSRRRRERSAEIEAAKAFYSAEELKVEKKADEEEEAPPNEELIRKVLNLWTISTGPIENLLRNANIEPPTDGPAEPGPDNAVRLTASVALIQRSAQLLKGGYLLVPSLDSSKWVRRFVELRRPYLHIHSIPEGEEIGIVNLRNSRVDHQPQIAKLLRQDGKGRDRKETVFAIYGTDNTWLFAARSEREKVDWIFKIDQAYFGSGNGSADEDVDAES